MATDPKKIFFIGFSWPPSLPMQTFKRADAALSRYLSTHDGTEVGKFQYELTPVTSELAHAKAGQLRRNMLERNRDRKYRIK